MSNELDNDGRLGGNNLENQGETIDQIICSQESISEVVQADCFLSNSDEATSESQSILVFENIQILTQDCQDLIP